MRLALVEAVLQQNSEDPYEKRRRDEGFKFGDRNKIFKKKSKPLLLLAIAIVAYAHGGAEQEVEGVPTGSNAYRWYRGSMGI